MRLLFAGLSLFAIFALADETAAQGYGRYRSNVANSYHVNGQVLLPFAVPTAIPVATYGTTYSGVAVNGHYYASGYPQLQVPLVAVPTAIGPPLQSAPADAQTRAQVATEPHAETELLKQELAQLRAMLDALAAGQSINAAAPEPGSGAAAILKAKCHACHNPAKATADGGHPVFFDEGGELLAKLQRRRIFEAAANRVDAKIFEGSTISPMPPEGHAALTVEELSELQAWAEPSADSEY